MRNKNKLRIAALNKAVLLLIEESKSNKNPISSQCLRIAALSKALMLLIEESRDYHEKAQCHCGLADVCEQCQADENFLELVDHAEKIFNACEDKKPILRELVEDKADYVVEQVHENFNALDGENKSG